jgi:hypothetical protein
MPRGFRQNSSYTYSEYILPQKLTPKRMPGFQPCSNTLVHHKKTRYITEKLEFSLCGRTSSLFHSPLAPLQHGLHRAPTTETRRVQKISRDVRMATPMSRPMGRSEHMSLSAQDAILHSPSVSSWIASAVPGYCAETDRSQREDCENGRKGSRALSAWATQSRSRAVKVCLSHCSKCKQCNFITVGVEARDCSWYLSCNLTRLESRYEGFISGGAPYTKTEHHKLGRADTQNVLLFMHLEKTGGTRVRHTMHASGWGATDYCADGASIVRQVQERLEHGESRIFVEHHCGIEWSLPRRVEKVVKNAIASGRKVRFRSFTMLRSPMSLAYSHFNYCEHTSSLRKHR